LLTNASEQIDRAVGALLALALDLAVADQAIEPRAGLASIKGADQPRVGISSNVCSRLRTVFLFALWAISQIGRLDCGSDGIAICREFISPCLQVSNTILLRSRF
jgi:hypothetical protein